MRHQIGAFALACAGLLCAGVAAAQEGNPPKLTITTGGYGFSPDFEGPMEYLGVVRVGAMLGLDRDSGLYGNAGTTFGLNAPAADFGGQIGFGGLFLGGWVRFGGLLQVSAYEERATLRTTTAIQPMWDAGVSIPIVPKGPGLRLNANCLFGPDLGRDFDAMMGFGLTLEFLVDVGK